MVLPNFDDGSVSPAVKYEAHRAGVQANKNAAKDRGDARRRKLMTFSGCLKRKRLMSLT